MTATVARPVAPPQKSKKEDRPVIDAARAKSLYTTRAVQADPFSESLIDAQIRQFREQGWVAIEGVYSDEEVQAAKVALGDLIHGRIARKEGINYVQEEPAVLLADGTPAPETPEERELRVRKVFVTFNYEHHHPRIEAMTMQSRLRHIVDQLIAPNSRLIQTMALLKPPRIGSEKPWHQDTAYFDWLPLGGVVGCWIALDRAAVENGCMQVIPGTHLEGPVAHFHHRDCQIPDERVQTNRAIAVPLAPGGVLFFSGLIHHGTPPNIRPTAGTPSNSTTLPPTAAK